jgi:hypothetical protein
MSSTSGGCLLTVRDYDQEPRGKNIIKPIRAFTRNSVRNLVVQVWDFEKDHYDVTMFILRRRWQATTFGPGKCDHAITQLAEQYSRNDGRDGLPTATRLDGVFYQPVLVGTKPN